MEYLNFKFCCKISKGKQLFVLLMMFLIHSYSASLDTVQKPNCPNGFLIQVNGIYRCIDTTLNYYPVWTEKWLEEDKYYFMMKSINLQLLDEKKWYKEDIQDEKLRIYTIKYPPMEYLPDLSDSIILYSVVKQNHNIIKLIKKEMPVFNNIGFSVHDVHDYFSDLDIKYLLNIPEEVQNMNYKQTEFMISKKEMKKLLKQLDRLKNCETFYRYGTPPNFVIEYSMNGNYFLLIAKEPKEWSAVLPEFVYLEKTCRRKDGLKIMKWLSNY